MRRAHRFLQRGAGLVETMVGILIGLIVVLVIYNMLAAAEGYKRMTQGASDAQITGLLAQFMVGREAANGGNGISVSASTLEACVDPNLRPVPVLVTDSGSNDISDSFITTYSGAPHVIWPVPFTADAAPGASFVVQTPNGFSSPVPSPGVPYRVIAVDPSTGNCELTQVTAATAPDPASGDVTLTQTGTAFTYKSLPDFTQTSKLVNLGPVGLATRARYEVWDSKSGVTCANAGAPLQCQVTSTDLYIAGASRNPIAQNVVLMKVQYGINLASPLNGQVDCWTPANAANVCNAGAPVPTDWTPAQVQTYPAATLERIVAVRLGLVVRSDEADLKDTSLAWGTRPAVVLFNCAANNATCQSRVVVGPNVILDGWRYRAYEAVIPLRNAIYNALP